MNAKDGLICLAAVAAFIGIQLVKESLSAAAGAAHRRQWNCRREREREPEVAFHEYISAQG